MQHEGLDGLIITRPSNVQYLTGYDRLSDEIPLACVVPLDEMPVLILAESQSTALNHDPIMAKIRTYTCHEFNDWNFPQGSDFWPEIVAAVSELGLASSNIGLEQNWLSIREFEGLKSLLPEAAFTDFSQMLWRLRQIKDAAELEAIRHAAKVAEIGIRTALEIVDVGKTEIEISLEIESAMRGAGGQLRGIRAAVLAGEHGRHPFAKPGIGRLANESTVVIDITVSFSGYFAEIARTILLGTPTSSQRGLFTMASTLLDHLEQNIVPGSDLGKIATQSLASIKAQGSLCDVLLPLGNSIGLDLHEPPFIDPSSTSGVREGLVLSLRPVCFTHSVGVVKMADVIFVTDEGIENLTTLSRETL